MKIIKHLFIVLDIMSILYCLETLYNKYVCTSYPDVSFRCKISGFFYSPIGNHIVKILALSVPLLLILSIVYFIYLLINKSITKNNIYRLVINLIIVIFTFIIVSTCNYGYFI